MDPSSLQQHQQMSSQSLENMIACSKASSQQDQRKARPQPEEALKCPRCDSTNTKFCYYNNYSLSQPRYFCKSCRRYWTKGGTLRNVPVGGGCRKNKRSSSSSSSSSSKRVQDQTILTPNNVNNPITTFSTLSYDNPTNDLNMALARLQKQSCTYDNNNDLSIHYDLLGNPTNHHHPTGFLDVFRSGFMETQSNTTENNNIQSLYYGDNNMGEVVDNGGSETMMMMPYDHQEISNNNAPTTQAVTVTTMKQEIMSSNGRYSSEQSENYSNNRVLWGLPWQLNNNNGDMNMLGGIDSGRSSWNNNGLNSPWYGLLNSPLM